MPEHIFDSSDYERNKQQFLAGFTRDEKLGAMRLKVIENNGQELDILVELDRFVDFILKYTSGNALVIGP